MAERNIVHVAVDLFERAAHAIRADFKADFRFRDDDIDAIRREAAILRAVELLGTTREQASEQFDEFERSDRPAARARIAAERQFLRFALRALATHPTMAE